MATNDISVCQKVDGFDASEFDNNEIQEVRYKWTCFGPGGTQVRLKTTCGVGGILQAVFDAPEVVNMKAGKCFKGLDGAKFKSYKLTDAATAKFPPCKEVPKPGPKRVCDCQKEFEWKSATYYGCTETPDTTFPWCFVEDNNCNVAMQSGEWGETRKFIECDPCDCQRIWEYKGATYYGCTVTPDPDMKDQEWCYTNGYSSQFCLSAKDSKDPAETRKWRECDSCNCRYFWHYAKEAGKIDPILGLIPSYKGCGQTDDWADVDWCYVQSFNKQCNYTQKSLVDGETRFWRKCDNCNCMRSWNYKGQVYGGCAETPDWQNVEWCYVEGGESCNVASKSKTAGERRYFRECSSCNCMRRWNYKGEYYIGCSQTPDWENTDWCYVQGYSNCKNAQASQFKTEKRWYRTCKGCTCQFTWNYRGAVYRDCAKTPDMKETEWCYVQGGPACSDAKKSTEKGELRMWRECGNKMTCGIIKQKFKDNKCCGNPSKTYKYKTEPKEPKPARRLLGSHNELSRDILAQVGAAIRQVKAKGVSAYGLEHEIMSATKRYFDGHVSVV